MSLVFFLKILVSTPLLPPTNGLLLLALAALFRRRRWAFGLALCGGLLLLAQSLPPVANALIATLEQRAGPALTDPAGAQAIVVLGSGLQIAAEEYAGDTANERSLVRLRYGATLARRLQLPLLVSGGRPDKASRSEAEVMAEIIEREFGIPVRWQEIESKDTADNATMSATILKAAGIHRVILVTQAFHMPRAKHLFEAAGLEVIPGPTDFKGRRDKPLEVFGWLPQASALHTSYYALHEWLGLAWARVSPAKP
ncbi:MAG: YdcF family protein [Betaproteobacteria bacterium HGW-Betaproteobacteria-10]|nr:MAG: YdcF family protein [Betaproteobacteria bacterium HGW-Betaproteobacteria-10]